MKTGHLYFAIFRTFLLWVDSAILKNGKKVPTQSMGTRGTLPSASYCPLDVSCLRQF
jgi:hypothetical protein